jgi:RNA polymerase sigma-70 factor (ECF subfamily)
MQADRFLVRTAVNVLNCESAAKDAVQQTLIRVWKHADSLQGSIEALLHVSVRRQAMSHFISRKRRIAAMEFFWGEIIPDRPGKADPRVDGLMTALGELPEKKQALLQKRFFEGKSVGEIAKEVGLSKSATQGRLHHAEGALLQCFTSGQNQTPSLTTGPSENIFKKNLLPQRMSDRGC